MKVAITGASGFVGKRLVLKHFSNGDETRVLLRKKSNISFPQGVKIFYGDISNNLHDVFSFVKDVDVLYHCAAETRNKPLMHDVNYLGTKKLIEICRENIRHWVQLSSVGVYGPPVMREVNESHPLQPSSIYQKTKLMSDNLLIGKENGFSHTILRPSNIYGPDMPNKSLFQLIKTIDLGLFFFIGPQGASANYISVTNVVDALILCGTKPQARGNIYNVSDWRTIEDFIGIISRCLGRSIPKRRLSASFIKKICKVTDLLPGSPLTLSRVNALTSNCIYESKLIEELGYSHKVSMEDGLADLINAYRSHRVLSIIAANEDC